jgi:hypothetical protein
LIPATPPVATAGYAGKGTLQIQTTLGGASLGGPSLGGLTLKVTVNGDIGLEARGQLLRVDLLDLAIPGSDPLLSALASSQLIPPGGFTVVYDRSASTYTVWSSAKRAYYVGGGPTQGGAQGGATPGGASPAGGADAALGAGADLFKAFAFARSLKDDSAFNVTLTLAGHGTVNGHPATAVDYQYARTTNAGASTAVAGRLQLADDLDEVPVEVTATLKTQSIPESALRLDLTTLSKANVPPTDFQPPAGYFRANAIGDVLGKSLQM